MITARHALALVSVLLAGCDEPAAASSPDAAAPKPAASATASARPPAPPPTASAASAGEFKVLKLQFTTGVRNKEPIDSPTTAEAGQRIYAHITARNRGEAARPISLVFLVAGTERSKIDLKVEPSWSYRTWGYVTLRRADMGELVAEVRDDRGTVMERAKIPIVGANKPQEK